MRRRGLRLNWRALALLGALLAMVIEWSGVVYGMPTTMPPAPAPPQSGELPTTPGNISLAISLRLRIAALQQLKESVADPNCTDYVAGSGNGNDGRILCDVALSEVRQEQKSSNGGDDNDNGRRETSSGRESWTYNADRAVTVAADNAADGSDHSQRGNSSGDGDGDGSRQPATATTSSDVQLQRIKMSNLISNKRKRKKPNDRDEGASDCAEAGRDVCGILSNYSISISGANESQHPGSLDRTRSPNASTQTPLGGDRLGQTVNEIEDATTTLAPQHEVGTATPAPSVDVVQDESSGAELPFTFSSSHHIAILSRTERSIHAGRDHPVIVRRSFDADAHSRAVTKSKRLNNSRNTSIHINSHPNTNRHLFSNLDRNERSTIAHLSGPARKVQLYIKNRFIQLLPDGTVNGTQDDQSEYTILQRSTIDVGRIKIQGVGTCLYLCMDQCGSVYGSKDFSDDCVFNENMEQHNYNTYSSTYNSNSRRIYYLALNRHGEPRRLQIPPTRSLGKLATYTNAITETVPQERVERLIAKNFGANRIKHGLRQLCDTGKPLIELIDGRHFKARPKCNPNTSTSSNSNSSSSSLSISNSSLSKTNHNNNSRISGQLLKNVPAANDKARSSISNSSAITTNSSSNSNSPSSLSSNSSSSRDTSSSSSSLSVSQSNNGHISDKGNSSNSSSSSLGSANHHSGAKKKKKRRKCRPLEDEEEHNCQRGPQALRKRGGGPKQRCKELQQQQLANGAEVVTQCGPKRGGGGAGPKKNSGSKNGKKAHNGAARGSNNSNNSSRNVLSGDGLGPNNRRGKKLGAANGRQGPAGNGGKHGGGIHRAGGGVGGNKKRAKNQNGVKRPNGGKPKKQHTKTTSTTTTTSTARPSVFVLETSTALPTTTVYEHLDTRAESTSDRADREQRNVHFKNPIEETDDSAEDDEDDSDTNDDDGSDGDADADGDTDADGDYDEEASMPSSSRGTAVGGAGSGETYTQLIGAGSEDALYYDQLDFVPLGLWELFALMWIAFWTTRRRF